MEQVTADEVLPLKRRHVLDALMQLYLHDLSEHASLNTSHGEVGEDGRFDYRWLDNYWHEPGRVPLLIRADGRIAGFVLVNQWSALDRPLDHAIAEFFVLRKSRRAHVGTRAAHQLFRHMPGRWEVPVASYNPESGSSVVARPGRIGGFGWNGRAHDRADPSPGG